MKHPLVSRVRGFSLIELLVAMAIGLILTLAISSVLIRSEGSKRSSNSVNDINQSGAFVAYVLDRAIRSAGSGFSQSWSTSFGCRLNLSSSSVTLPASIPASSAFTGFTFPVRLAPFIIGKSLADTGTETRGDVLMVMAGTAGVGESPQTVNTVTAGASAALGVQSALGYTTGDVVLLVDPAVTAPRECLLQRVDTHLPANGDTALPLLTTGAGSYSDTSNVGLGSFVGKSPIALQLGRDGANPPQFKLYGVGANNTLMSYDLLQPTAPDASVSDGIVEMRAVYGLDTTSPPDGVLDTWVDATGAFAASALTDGTATSQANLRQIVAVRIGLILRTSLQERAPSSSGSGVLSPESFAQSANTTLTLFSDLPTAVQRTRVLSTAELAYRFRTVEVTIPLRNVLLAPQS